MVESRPWSRVKISGVSGGRVERVAEVGEVVAGAIDKRSVVLLDGGMGQELIRRSASEPTPLWSTQVMLDRPELVRDLHLDFIRAGARVVTLNTYTATPQRLGLAGMGDKITALQEAAIKAARDAIALSGESGISVAGCLPPLVATYRPDVAPSYDESLTSYRTIVALQAPHVDVLLCEALSSCNEARAAATAALESGLPVWVSLTLKDDHTATLRSGEPLADAVAMLETMGVNAILVNCSAPEAITSALKVLNTSHLPTGAYANGFTSIAALAPGGTVSELKARQDLGPDQYANHAMHWVESGLSLVGGCCEVGPAHIARVAERLNGAGLVCKGHL